MKVTVLTLDYHPDRGFDATAINDFCRDHDILSCQQHFFAGARGPALALVLEYRERPQPNHWGKPANQPADTRAEVPPEHRPLFDALRKWRADRARLEGKPHYIFLRNPELIEIATKRPLTTAALSDIAGVGEAKLASYGAELLAIVAAHSTAQPATTEQPSSAHAAAGTGSA